MTADEVDSALAAETLQLAIGRRWRNVHRYPNTLTKLGPRGKFNVKVQYGTSRTPYPVNETTLSSEIRDTRRNGPND